MCRNIPASHTTITGVLHENLHALLNQSGTQLATCLLNREILFFSSPSSFTEALYFWLWFPSQQMSILFLPNLLFSIFDTLVPQAQFEIIHPL
jgi:hypothetical protein